VIRSLPFVKAWGLVGVSRRGHGLHGWPRCHPVLTVDFVLRPVIKILWMNRPCTYRNLLSLRSAVPVIIQISILVFVISTIAEALAA
jgi:hypothetical protein